MDGYDNFTLLSISAKVHFRKRLQGFGVGQLYPEDEGPGTGWEFFDVSTFEYKICGEDFMLSSGDFPTAPSVILQSLPPIYFQ